MHVFPVLACGSQRKPADLHRLLHEKIGKPAPACIICGNTLFPMGILYSLLAISPCLDNGPKHRRKTTTGTKNSFQTVKQPEKSASILKIDYCPAAFSKRFLFPVTKSSP
ncbi:MAG TPA: hypothetical protein VFW07_14330 [Parafilimonas sp.]|nr:hypothetical protein [Parafilimonas sp.]